MCYIIHTTVAYCTAATLKLSLPTVLVFCRFCMAPQCGRLRSFLVVIFFVYGKPLSKSRCHSLSVAIGKRYILKHFYSAVYSLIYVIAQISDFCLGKVLPKPRYHTILSVTGRKSDSMQEYSFFFLVQWMLIIIL